MGMKHIQTAAINLLVILLATLTLSQSGYRINDPTERVRAYTRPVEFDFIDWTLDALLVKNVQGAVKAPQYMSVEDQRRVVFEYLDLVRWINRTKAEVDQIYANPDIADPSQSAAELNEQLRILSRMEESLKPIAEAVLQEQVSATVAEMGLSMGGQPLPPVLYHTSRLPNALIVSPRDRIQQDANISLVPEMTIEEIIRLEDEVANGLNVSALVAPVGGIGTYPTMVMSTTNLVWLTEVVAHEWTHNYLTLHPLGINYMTSGQLRTMNETTANIAGKEIGQAVMARFYPELAPPPPVWEEPEPENLDGAATPQPEEDLGVFNFNREMRKTRMQVDELLAEGKVEQAEAYMETRRRFFWDNGYQIRKLNQAYFAFYGAYDDTPGGGAAGRDPVGPAVRELRRRSASLEAFLEQIAWMSSFDGLLRELERAEAGPYLSP